MYNSSKFVLGTMLYLCSSRHVPSCTTFYICIVLYKQCAGHWYLQSAVWATVQQFAPLRFQKVWALALAFLWQATNIASWYPVSAYSYIEHSQVNVKKSSGINKFDFCEHWFLFWTSIAGYLLCTLKTFQSTKRRLHNALSTWWYVPSFKGTLQHFLDVVKYVRNV